MRLFTTFNNIHLNISVDFLREKHSQDLSAVNDADTNYIFYHLHLVRE